MGNDNSENRAASVPQDNGTKQGNDIPDSDKQYYTDLYNDLPREVVDILMQTHPLMGKNDDPDTAAYRTRRPQQRDMEVIRKERMSKVGEEIQREMAQANEEDHRESRSKKERHPQSANPNKRPQDKPSHYSDEPYTGEDDRVQYVQVRADYRPRSKQNIPEQQPHPKKKTKKQPPQEDFDFGGNSVSGNKKNYIYEDIDFEAKAKEEELNRLYSDDYDDEERISLGEHKKVIVGVVVAVLLIGFLGFKCFSLSNKLAKAQDELQSQVEISSKYEEAKLENLNLQTEIKRLKGETGEGEESGSGDGSGGTTGTTANGDYDVYTATSSDTYWGMAEKFYGNGSQFQKILDANGLTEADSVKAGQQYKIPK